MNFIEFIKIIILEGNLTPKLFIIMYLLLFFLMCGLTYIDENKNQKQYKYYKNDIYSQWRKLK